MSKDYLKINFFKKIINFMLKIHFNILYFIIKTILELMLSFYSKFLIDYF